MVPALLILATLFTPVPISTAGPTPGRTLVSTPEPADAPPGCKDQCTIDFNSCYNSTGDFNNCSAIQTACYNNCDGLGGGGGGGGGHIQHPY